LIRLGLRVLCLDLPVDCTATPPSELPGEGVDDALSHEPDTEAHAREGTSGEKERGRPRPKLDDVGGAVSASEAEKCRNREIGNPWPSVLAEQSAARWIVGEGDGRGKLTVGVR
jgi:hypothetical protein